MTKIAIVPNAAGTGTFTIEAPNSNSNRTLVLPDAAGEILTTTGNGSALTGVGKVLQVVQAYKTNIFTTTSVSFVEVPGLVSVITPSSANSKILVCINLNAATSNVAAGVQVWRNGAAIGLPDSIAGKTHRLWLNMYNGGDDTNSVQNHGMMYLDSPSSTSALTYAVRLGLVQGSGIMILNDLTSQASNTDFAGNFVSHLTLMEIAG
jgi:hypothetical protein